MRRLAAALLLGLAACSGPATSSASPEPARSATPHATPIDAVAAGAPGCLHRPSPSEAVDFGVQEIRGTAGEGQLWALVSAPGGSIPADDPVTIVVRMTGAGALQMAAVDAEGDAIRPSTGPDLHEGSSWDRPGDEWRTQWRFPATGCWNVHAVRGDVAGDLWLQVRG